MRSNSPQPPHEDIRPTTTTTAADEPPSTVQDSKAQNVLWDEDDDDVPLVDEPVSAKDDLEGQVLAPNQEEPSSRGIVIFVIFVTSLALTAFWLIVRALSGAELNGFEKVLAWVVELLTVVLIVIIFVACMVEDEKAARAKEERQKAEEERKEAEERAKEERKKAEEEIKEAEEREEERKKWMRDFEEIMFRTMRG